MSSQLWLAMSGVTPPNQLFERDCFAMMSASMKRAYNEIFESVPFAVECRIVLVKSHFVDFEFLTCAEGRMVATYVHRLA